MNHQQKKYNRREILQFFGVSASLLAAFPFLEGCDDDSDSSSDNSNSGAPDSGNDKFWLCDNYAPVEESEAFNLTVEGAIPPSLLGSYMRVGPNPSTGDSPHLFLGDGMVHRVRLEGGNATMYQSRYVQTRQLENGPWLEQSAPPLDYVPGNTSLIYHANKLLALTEMGLPYQLSPTDLSTVGVYDFGGSLKSTMTAHPKIDPITGELFFYGYSSVIPTINYHVASREGVLIHSTQFDLLGAPVFMHDFHVTATRSVFWDCPVIADLSLAANYGVGYKWSPDNGTRIGVLPRYGQGSEIKWFDIELGSSSHTINAYDDPLDPAAVILDTIYYPEFWVNSPIDFDANSNIVRFRLNTATGKITKDMVSELSTDFPRINERNQCHGYRYAYSALNPPTGAVGASAIVKTDFISGDSERYELSDGVLMGELVFVPDSEKSGEDEGWLMGFAHNSSDNSSRMNIFDATNLSSGPVAVVHLLSRVPWGFHGTFISES